jgi:hypothetical protein
MIITGCEGNVSAGNGAEWETPEIDTTVPHVSRVYNYLLGVILSFRFSQGCGLRRPVVDSVADGTPAA